MNILLVGGAGFIGHLVACTLKKQGHTVFIYDSLTSYGIYSSDTMTRVHRQRRMLLDSVPVKVGDISSEKFSEYLQQSRSEVVVFLASFPRQAAVAASPVVAASTMTAGLVSTLEAVVASKATKFVFVSSSMVYGDFSGPAVESQRRAPNTLYGILKAAGEDIVNDYGRRHGLDIAIVRPTAVYGPRDLPDRLVPTFFSRAEAGLPLNVHGEHERLDFTHATDAAAGIALVATSPAANGAYNVAAGESRLIKDAAEMIVALVGSGSVNTVERNSNMPSRDALDITRIKDLGYEPKFTLQVGLKEYWECQDLR